MFRAIIMIIICLITTGCDVGSIEESNSGTDTGKMTLTFTGSGDSISEDFWCEGCDAIFESGEGAFTASLMNDAHTPVAFVAVGDGQATTTHIYKGTYYFSVEGSGSWSVSITGDCGKYSDTSESPEPDRFGCGQGCCSGHGAVVGCEDGKCVCEDGYSSSCVCP